MPAAPRSHTRSTVCVCSLHLCHIPCGTAAYPSVSWPARQSELKMSSIACAFCAQADRQREHLFICLHQRTHTHNSQPLRVVCVCVCPLPQVIQREKSQIQGEDNIFSLLFQSKRLHFRTRRQKSIIKSNQPGNETSIWLHLIWRYIYCTVPRGPHIYSPPSRRPGISHASDEKHVFTVHLVIERVLVPNLR